MKRPEARGAESSPKFASLEAADTLERLRHLLADYQEPICQIMMREIGKPRWEVEHDVQTTLAYLDWLKQMGPDIHQLLKTLAETGPSSSSVVLNSVHSGLARSSIFSSGLGDGVLSSMPSHCLISSTVLNSGNSSE